ncbi:hypothetical protein TWF281_010414 [Arthrobotrys megalospora]
MAEQHSNPGSSTSCRRTRLNPEDWEPHQDRVRQLYLEQDLSAADTVQVLEREFGFTASVAQFNQQVRNWGLRKNLNEEDHNFIEVRKRLRDEEGKDTYITLCGMPINIEDLPRKRQRRFCSTLERLQGKGKQVCPSTPPGLFVGTPPQSPLPARSPSPFSWLVEQFGKIIDSRSFLFTIHPLYLKTPSYSFETILVEARASFLKGLFYTSDRDQDIQQRNIFAPSSIKGSQVRNLASQFKSIHGRLSLEDLISILKIYVIRFGNNVDESQVKSDILDALLQSDALTPHMSVLGQLLQVDSFMVSSFVIQLFYSAARTGILDLLRLILRLYDGKAHPKVFWKNNRNSIIATATQFALERQQGAGVSILLGTGFEVNTSPLSPISKSLLHTAVMVGDRDTVQELIDHGAKDVSDKDLRTRLYDKYIEQLEEMGYSWAKTVRQYAHLSYELPVENDLHLAIILRKKDITKLLLSRVEEGMRNFTYSEVDPSKLHFYAVLIDDDELLQYILNSAELALVIDVEERLPKGETALVSAVRKKRQGCAKTLLENGADPKALIRTADSFIYVWEETSKFLSEIQLGSVASKIDKRVKEIREERKRAGHRWSPGNQEDIFNVEGSFPSVGRNKAEILRYIDTLFGTHSRKGAEFKYALDVFEPLVKEIKFSIWEEGGIWIEMTGVLWDSENISSIKSVVGHFNKSLRGNVQIAGSYIAVFDSVPLSKKQELLNRAIKYSFPRRTEREEIIRGWDRSCMDVVSLETGQVYREALGDGSNGDGDSDGDDDDDDDDDMSMGALCYKLCFASSMSRLRNLDAQLRLGEFGELEFILEWALSVSNARFLRNLVTLCLPHIDSLTLKQKQALLRLAVRRGFEAVVDQILNWDAASYVTDMVVREAVWSDNTAIFDKIIDVYDIQAPSPNIMEHMLAIPICSADLHKVMRMVGREDFKANFLLGDTFTFIELAARLGRIDITQVLLKRGASRNLDLCYKRCFGFGTFCNRGDDPTCFRKQTGFKRDSSGVVPPAKC